MKEHTASGPIPVEVAVPRHGSKPGSFRLMRYFTLATLVAYAVVALALYLLQRNEEAFFYQAQREQGAFFARSQAELARQNEDTARASLVALHEASHVNLTRLVANMLWESDFAPFVAAAQRFPVDRCRMLAADGAASAAPAGARRECFAELGRKIRALPGFQALDAKAYAAMRSSTVFKIKVFDLRGITVYSSEPGQIGEDGAGNAGWKSASLGRPASELTHRNRFSAFERVVEDRDLISSYLPVPGSRRDEVVGVFEIYSDVTPFLAQIKAASKSFADIAIGNEARAAQTARTNQETVNSTSDRFLLIVGGLLALLYGVSLLIVRNGQRIIDRQMLAQEESTRREQLWHREKMAALATMAANVAHEVGNPLAIISGLAEELAELNPGDPGVAGASKLILGQTMRVGAMMRQIADFAAARGEEAEWVDVNVMVKAVCDFLGFDSRFHGTAIEFRPGERLPARKVVPDHLNEVMMSLLQAWVDGGTDKPRCSRIQVETLARDDDVEIRLSCAEAPGGPPVAIAAVFVGARFDSVRRRVAGMGGRLSLSATAVEITLPA